MLEIALERKGLMAAIIVGIILYGILPNVSAAGIEKEDVDVWCGSSSCIDGEPIAQTNQAKYTVDEGTWVGSLMFIDENRLDHVPYINIQAFEDRYTEFWGAGIEWDVGADEQIEDDAWAAHCFYSSKDVSIWSDYDDWDPYNYEIEEDHCLIVVEPDTSHSDWDIATDYREEAKIAIKIDNSIFNTTAPALGESETVEGIIIYSYEGVEGNSILYNTTSQQSSDIFITLFAN